MFGSSGHFTVEDVVAAGPGDYRERIEVTLITRRRAPLPLELIARNSVITRETLASEYGAHPSDFELIASVLAEYGIEIVNTDLGGRRVVASGTVGALEAAFGITLRRVTHDIRKSGRSASVYRYHDGRLRIPEALDGIVMAVLGVDDRPLASAHVSGLGGGTIQSAYTPLQVADIYQFPAGTDGSGQTLALVQLGGGFTDSDLDAYFAILGLPRPTVTAVGVDGAANALSDGVFGAEVTSTIEIAGAVAPGASQVVYFAPNTERGFVDAVTTAVHAAVTPTAVCISWGQSENCWTAEGMSALDQVLADAAALGTAVCIAAGNEGSSDGISDGQSHVDFPASSPHALACGGTSLLADPATGTIISEMVWNDGTGGATGGGVSETFALPHWQANAGVPATTRGGTGRGVPDVAGNADPATGYQVLIDGESVVIGGTSAAAAMWAALMCRVAQSTGQRPGAIQQRLYDGVMVGTSPLGMRSITQGNNGAYAAGPGWDPCTGLGTPQGASLLSRLAGVERATAAPVAIPPDLTSQPWRPEPPPASQISAGDELMRRALAELVQPGRLLFNPPDRMNLGQKEWIVIRLTRTLGLDSELRRHIRGSGEPRVEEIPTAPLMAVTLRGDGFRITAHSDEEQSVTPDDVTTWEFEIQAQERGRQQLAMCVSLRIPVLGHPLVRKSVPVREVTIDVQVATPALIGQFMVRNWQWFIGTAIGLAAVVVAVLVH